MVEHNLAKVGVASSNLVSRSIFLSIIFPILLLSNPITIQSEYCTDSEYLELIHLDPTSSTNFQILKLPASTTFQVPYLRIEGVLKEHGIKSIDASNGVVRVSRYCTTSEDFEMIRVALEEAFVNNYKEIAISSLIISPVNSLPIDFDEYIFESLKLNGSILRSSRGSVGAVFVNSNGVRKTINFRFTLSATISGFKARHNLSNGKILTPDDIEAVELELDKFASAPLEEFIPNSLVIKHFIREGSLLLSKQFEMAKLVRKRDVVDIAIEDGGLVISFKGEALDDGNVGDRIRVKSNDGKHFIATITSKNRVVVR